MSYDGFATDREIFQQLIETFPQIFVSNEFFARLIGIRPDRDSKRVPNELKNLSDELFEKAFGAAEEFARKYAATQRSIAAASNDNIVRNYLLWTIDQYKQRVLEQWDSVVSSGVKGSGDCKDEIDVVCTNMRKRLADLFDTMHTSTVHIASPSQELDKKQISMLMDNMKKDVEKVLLEGGIEPYKVGKIVDKVVESGANTINEWRKNPGDIRDDYKRAISAAFGVRSDIWDSVETYELDRDYVFSKLFLPLDPSKTTDPIKRKIETYIGAKDIQRKYRKALGLKREGKYADALEIVDEILEDRGSFKVYAPLLHLKAILLSTNDLKRWDEAIAILSRLYYSCDYHVKEPEVITLLASNFKRKAMFDERGELRDRYDEEVLKKAIDIYHDAYVFIDRDRWYNAINLAYLLLLQAKNHEEFEKAQEEIKKMYRETGVCLNIDNSKELGENDVWRCIACVEFSLLMGDLFDAERYWKRCPSALSADQRAVLKRQMELFLHFFDENISPKAKELKNGIEIFVENHLSKS